MLNEIGLKKGKESSQNPAGFVAPAENSLACQMHSKGWLAMVVCCAAPFVLVGAIALFGISLGALASGFLSVATLLACPVGMYLMMRMMTKQNAGKAKGGDN